MRRLAASRQGFDPSVSFPNLRTRTPDPQETFIISVALRQVSGLSSRTEQEITESFSVEAANAFDLGN